jgi:sugar lactone lactonase YvrE
MTTADVLLDAKAILGEGPAWDARSQTLYWVDISRQQLHVTNTEDRFLQLPDRVSCAAPCQSGGLIVAMGLAFWRLDVQTGALEKFAAPAGEPSTNRFNDGKSDPAGRFLAGTMDDAERQTTGSLYSLQPNGQITPLLHGVGISNGLAWSPDLGTLYFIDTPTRTVKAFKYDRDTGLLADARTVLQIPDGLGWPDGMTSDTDGCLWIAMWGGAAVTRWDPKHGRMLEAFRLPALNPTSCVFGGRELTDLYITSARKGLDRKSLREYPYSGAVFRLRTRSTGMPTFEFGA